MSIHEAKLPPDQGVIDYLEDLLERAKDGDIQAIATVTYHRGSYTGNGWAGVPYVMSMLGEMLILQRDFIDLQVDLRADEL